MMVLALTWLVGAALGLGPVPPAGFAVECLIAVPAAQPLIAVQSLLSMRMRSFAAPVAVCFGGIVVGVALVLKGGALANAWPQSLVTRALTLGSQTLGTVGALDASGLVALLAGTAVCGAVCWGCWSWCWSLCPGPACMRWFFRCWIPCCVSPSATVSGTA